MRKLLTLSIIAALLVGCQSADPASRSNRTAYRDIRADIKGNSNAVHITIGDGLYASADGGGDTQSNTPTQTTDTKPEVAVGLGGGSAGTGNAQPTGGITDKALSGFGKLMAGKTITADEAAAVKDCVDGSCETP